MTNGRDIRDYGFGDSNRYIDGTPEVVQEAKGVPACPNCGCMTLYMVRIKVKDVPMLSGGRGVGTYIGCPACPWASPMLMVGTREGAT